MIIMFTVKHARHSVEYESSLYFISGGVVRLLALTLLCFTPFFAQAAALDTCTRLIDEKKADTLRQALDDAGLPHYIDGRTVCVEEKHRYTFKMLLKEAFPHPSEVVHKDWIVIPKSPSGRSLEYLMPTNPALHAAVQKVLSERDIWFTTDKENILWFEVANRSTVLDIIFDISEGKIKVK